MSYRNRLDSLKNDKELFSADTRAEEIQKDMMNAFADGSVFGETIAEAVSSTIGKAIEKSGLDGLVSDGIDSFKSMVSEAVMSAFKNNDFVKSFSEKMAQSEAERGKDFGQDKGQEMGS